MLTTKRLLMASIALIAVASALNCGIEIKEGKPYRSVVSGLTMLAASGLVIAVGRTPLPESGGEDAAD